MTALIKVLVINKFSLTGTKLRSYRSLYLLRSTFKMHSWFPKWQSLHNINPLLLFRPTYKSDMMRLLGRAGIGLFCFLSSLCSGRDYGFYQPSGMAFAVTIGHLSCLRIFCTIFIVIRRKCFYCRLTRVPAFTFQC